MSARLEGRSSKKRAEEGRDPEAGTGQARRLKRGDVREYALAEYRLARSRNYLAELGRIPATIEGSRVLDLAGGPGTWTELFARAGARTVCWTDRSPEFLRYARAYVEGRGLAERVRFVLSDLASIPFREETFDIVFCRLALHHSPDETATLEETARVLKGGGVAVVTAQRVGILRREARSLSRKLAQYLSPVLAEVAGRKLLPTRYHLESRLARRFERAGLVVELWDSTRESSLYVVARKPANVARTAGPTKSARTD